MIGQYTVRRLKGWTVGLNARAWLSFFGMIVGAAQFQTAIADELEGRAPFSDPQAKRLALRAHAEAAAFDKLPQFYYRVEAGNGDVATMLDVEGCSLPLLIKALDEPISRNRWFETGETLAWNEKQALSSMFDIKFKNETQQSIGDKYRQDQIWSMNEAFQRSQTEDQAARFVYVQNPSRIWERRLMQLAYFRVTRHQFWWGRSSDHNDTISDVAPELAGYRSGGREQFDGEDCDIVESAARADRFWIGRESERLRGVLVSMFRGEKPTEFYKTEFVEKMAGRPISSQKEYQEWAARLSAQQKAELTMSWNETYFDQFGPNELIRFRDYREVAPGVWIPFREDRVFTHLAANGSKRKKYIRLFVLVQEARTDVDLSDAIERLQPQDGDQIEDQRSGVVLNYKYRKERTQSEILEMVEAERQKVAENAALIEKMTAPIAELVGKPAPGLPADGWIGGDRPELAGTPYIVHFWATWCGPCKNDLPVLKKLSADGLRVVGMHPAGTPLDEVAKVISEKQLGYPTLLESNKAGDGQQKIAGYPVAMVPYCILVDREGRVAGHGSLGPELLATLRTLIPAKEKTDQN